MSILYVGATPIGNMEDLTLRMKRLFEEVDIVACEDTRVTGNLLHKLGIKKKMISLYQPKEREKSEYLISLMKEEDISILLVSDNGTPTVSDPGWILVDKCINEGIEVVPIPGPSAFTTAICSSGFSADSFYFLGFLPKKPGKKIKTLKYAKSVNGLIIIYESPFRLVKTLEDIETVYGSEVNVFVGRELTKMHEEKNRGNVKHLLNFYKEKSIKGEIVIIIENYINIKEIFKEFER